MQQLEKPIAKTLPDVSIGEERRRHTRFLCVDGGVLRVAVRPEFRGRRALLVDVSTGGIGFLLPDALETGTVMVFEIQAAGESECISRVARVRHCRPHVVPPDAPWMPTTPIVANIFRRIFGMETPQNQGWLVGCEFDRPLSKEELMQFLDSLPSNHARER